jgi:transposase
MVFILAQPFTKCQKIDINPFTVLLCVYPIQGVRQVNFTTAEIEQLKARPSLSRPELAERFGVSVNTITNWIHEGRFRTATGQPAAWRKGRNWRVLVEAAERLEEAMELIEGAGVVNVHELGDIAVLTVEYDQ